MRNRSLLAQPSSEASSCSSWEQIQRPTTGQYGNLSRGSPGNTVLEVVLEEERMCIYHRKDRQEDMQRRKRQFWNHSGLSTSTA
ncbi:hypothetical protein LEMLEM_LOCUS17437 [Lemmus lemmus]